MAYLPGFDYDIFISYAHVNNQTADGSEEGWVAQFQKHLEVQLSTLIGQIGLVKIWWDPALDGSQLFDQTIQDRINRSALFLALTSYGYLQSDYCRRELQWFCQKAKAEPWGLSIGDRMRILNLLLNNIPHTEWPEEYGRTSGYSFHDAQSDAIGFASDPKEKLFKPQLRDLVEGLYHTLVAFHDAASAALSRAGAPVANQEDNPVQATATSCSVFLADTSDALRLLRRRITNELQQQGIQLMPQIPPPYEANPHAEKVVAAMGQATLSVHLLDAWPGREIEGEPEKSYPRQQAELGTQHAREQLIWVPQALELQVIEDEGYRQFLDQLENGPRTQARYRLAQYGFQGVDKTPAHLAGPCVSSTCFS